MAKDGRKTKELTHRQELFAHEYLKDLNALEAARRAGYSEGGVQAASYQLMNNEKVLDRIAELERPRLKKMRVDADYVLRQAVKIHEKCLEEDSYDVKASLAALKLIGDHIKVAAFKTQTVTEVVGANGGAIQLQALPDEVLLDKLKEIGDGRRTNQLASRTIDGECRTVCD